MRVGERMGLASPRQRIAQLEQKAEITVTELKEYTAAIGLRPGDLLDRSRAPYREVSTDLVDIVEMLEQIPLAALDHIREIIRHAAALANDPHPQGRRPSLQRDMRTPHGGDRSRLPIAT